MEGFNFLEKKKRRKREDLEGRKERKGKGKGRGESRGGVILPRVNGLGYALLRTGCSLSRRAGVW